MVIPSTVPRSVTNLVSPRVVDQDTVLQVQGSPASMVWRIERGIVKLVHQAPDGRQMITDLLVRGQFVGVEAVLRGIPARQTARTVGPVKLLCWTPSGFLEKLKAEPEFALTLVRELCAHVYKLQYRVEGLGLDRARERLLSLLEELAEWSGKTPRPADSVRLPLSIHDIAELIGVAPSYLSQLWNSLEREGKVMRRKRRVWLVKQS